MKEKAKDINSNTEEKTYESEVKGKERPSKRLNLERGESVAQN